MKRLILLLIAVVWACSARAELWGYVDGAGVAHFASARLDARYGPVISGSSAALAHGRVPGKSDSTGGLLTWMEISPEVRVLQPLLREAAARHGVDMELLKALIAVESGFNAKAVSPRGALGLMQLMPDTADRYATRDERRRLAAERMLEPRINIETGARMLADLMRRQGRVDLALAAWNAGEGAVTRGGGRIPNIPETWAHVEMVMELYWALLQQSLPRAAHGIELHGPLTVGRIDQ